jgi:hypothetical protein
MQTVKDKAQSVSIIGAFRAITGNASRSAMGGYCVASLCICSLSAEKHCLLGASDQNASVKLGWSKEAEGVTGIDRE